MRALHQIIVRPVLPAELTPLRDLAQNLRWVWDEPTRALFAEIDPQAWVASRENPVRLLELVDPARLAELTQDDAFLARVTARAAELEQYLTQPRWYQNQGLDCGTVAYFSPEYGITAALPQYSGGLGILAGDHLKAASDLGLPLIGVGLLYATGYFRQSFSRDGWQLEDYPDLHIHRRPLRALLDAQDRPALISIDLPQGQRLHAKIWVADVGRVPLLLLDTDTGENTPELRSVTDRLYGGDSTHRLRQELLLGVGGVRAVRVWSELTGAPAPTVMHTNEGHAGFLGVERIRELISQSGLSFTQAAQAVRAGTVFTTHTPVPAGIDRFERDLVRDHLAVSCELAGADLEQALALGHEPNGDAEIFNMAMLGLRLGGRANGVSTLHGEVSRGMFEALWPGFDAAEVPITSITNGVHAPTWQAPELSALALVKFTVEERESAAGWLNENAVSDAELWQLRTNLRANLVAEVRRRVRESWLQRGAGEAELGWTEEVFDPNVLTIGFARRVPTYKRLTLMLRDPQRLTALLTDSDRPIQLVIAGKAHPADEQGKELIAQMVRFADQAQVRHRIVFLPNYDIEMAQDLYQGCDVWLNNPLRPLEACGTSGMKAALNGCLNLSILDGWWDEWYDGRNGWAIPTADGVSDPERRDDLEAGALYDLLEKQIVPRFYDRPSGLPTDWLADVRHTLATLGPKVQATRMVIDYATILYAPANREAHALSANAHSGAKELAEWVNRVREQWPSISVADYSFTAPDQPAVGDGVAAWAEVALGELSAQDVHVQLLLGPVDDHGNLSPSTTVNMRAEQSSHTGLYRFIANAQITAAGPLGAAIRVVPSHPRLQSAAELGLVVHAR